MALQISGASQVVPSTLVDNTVYMIKNQLNEHIFPAGSLAAAQQLAGPATVKPTGPALTEFSFVTYPTKMDYLVGEAMEWAGASFTATYADGTKKDLEPGAAGLSLSPAEGTIITEDIVNSSKTFEIAATYTDHGKSLKKNTWGLASTIIADPHDISVRVGETATFTVRTATAIKDFTVSVEDETIATASASGSVVTVTGVSMGHTGVYVLDSDNHRQASALVDVRP